MRALTPFAKLDHLIEMGYQQGRTLENVLPLADKIIQTMPYAPAPGYVEHMWGELKIRLGDQQPQTQSAPIVITPTHAPDPVPTISNDNGAAPQIDEQNEEWVSTWVLPTEDRLQAIISFMIRDGRYNYTREQIELGAGWRHPDHWLDSETYTAMTRRLQRDLKQLIEEGDLKRLEKDNPKRKKGGFNNKIVLYALAREIPKEDVPTENVVSRRSIQLEMKKHLTSALDALDALDIEKLRFYLSTALDAVDALDADNYVPPTALDADN